MNGRAWYRYGLRLRREEGGDGGANARSARRVLEGFLIRVEGGFGCVQPWPELGDAPLDTHWKAFVEGGSTPLLDRALFCAAADGEARSRHASLFAGLPVPRSHATLAAGSPDFERLRTWGFTAVKLKGGRDVRAVAEMVRRAAAAGLRVRIDFNSVLDETEFRRFREALEEENAVGAVDWVEDPVPWQKQIWRNLRQETGLKLALDRMEPGEVPIPGAGRGQPDGPARGPDQTLAGMEEAFDFRVWKPAVEAVPRGGPPLVVTSSMDHPLGQAFAAWEAGRLENGRCVAAGLLTHTLFEPDAFTGRLAAPGPAWQAPAGTGLGFDDLLAGLEWTPVPGPEGNRIRWQRWAGRVLANPRDPLPSEGLPALEHDQTGFATSGSTGAPSVVLHRQASLEASARGVNSWLEARAEDVWLRALPDFHVGGWQIGLRADLAGSRVRQGPERWEVAELARLCEEEGATLISLVPAQLADLARLAKPCPAPVRAVLAGGGAVDPAVLGQLWKLGWPVIPSYGATEGGSMIAVAEGAPWSTAPGTPLPANPESPWLVLLAHWQARLASGTVREDGSGLLELAGPALAETRLMRRAEPDGGWSLIPLAGPDGWWRTPDFVFLSGNRLRFAGRADRVVKVLGELVNLEAVERALVRAGLAAGSFAVMPQEDPRRGAALVLVTEEQEEKKGKVPAAEAAVEVYHSEAPPFARILAVRPVALLPRSPLGKIRYAEVAEIIRHHPGGVPQ